MIIRVHDTTETTRRTWFFWVGFPHISLTRYVEESKTKRQRKWSVDREYDGSRPWVGMIYGDVPRPAWVSFKAHEYANTLMKVAEFPAEHTHPQGKVTVC